MIGCDLHNWRAGASQLQPSRMTGTIFLLYKCKNHSIDMEVGMHHAKNRGNKDIPLAIPSRILAQSCVYNPLSREGYA